MTTTAPISTPWYAVVGTTAVAAPCDEDGCRAPAEFEVGVAESGALVSDVLAHTCGEHLGGAVRLACEE